MFVVSVVAFPGSLHDPGGTCNGNSCMEATPDAISALNAQLGLTDHFWYSILIGLEMCYTGTGEILIFFRTSVLSASESIWTNLKSGNSCTDFCTDPFRTLGILAAYKKRTAM